MTSSYPLFPPELEGLAVACREAEHVECAGRVHLELREGKRLRTEILRHGRKGAIRHKGGGKDLPIPGTEFQRARRELHHKCVVILVDFGLSDRRSGEAAGSEANLGDGRGFAGLAQSLASFSAGSGLLEPLGKRIDVRIA